MNFVNRFLSFISLLLLLFILFCRSYLRISPRLPQGHHKSEDRQPERRNRRAPPARVPQPEYRGILQAHLLRASSRRSTDL